MVGAVWLGAVLDCVSEIWYGPRVGLLKCRATGRFGSEAPHVLVLSMKLEVLCLGSVSKVAVVALSRTAPVFNDC